MLFGSNPTSAIKWVYLPRILTRAVEHGARLVVVDPYLSDTAAKAQDWVSIRPGTDGALALAMAHVIIRDDLYDHDFVTAWTSGFDAYASYVADKTPEWAEEITSIAAATIERLAGELATTKPALVDTWSGPGQHSNAVQGGRAIALLNALIGSWDAPERFGFGDDDEVWVESPYGRVKARAKVTRRIHPEVVGLQHGFGHTALGRNAQGRGTRDGLVRPTKADALSGMSLHKEACVTLRPA